MEEADIDAALDNVFFKDFDGAPIGEKKGVLDNYLLTVQTRVNDAVSPYRTKTNTAEIKKVNEAYKELENFLMYFDVDYSGKNKSDETELKKAKDELEKYRPKNNSVGSNKRKI